MNYKKIILVLASVLVVAGVFTVAINTKKGSSTQTPIKNDLSTTTPLAAEPQRTDFGTNIPKDFPTDIPLEQGAKVEQSYSLNYSGQKQLTMVFLSIKTVKENYALYSDFLKKNNWNIVNKYESTKVSSLYGAKDINDINITITVGQVSISVLKK